MTGDFSSRAVGREG